MTSPCPSCKLPEAHASPGQCIAALRAELDRSEVWQDNQRLQRALDFAVGGLNHANYLNTADEALAIAKGER